MINKPITMYQTNERLIMPEYGIAALIEFNERQEARDAFKKLAYRKFKSLPLYLEWAPVDVFDGGDDQLDEIDNDNEDAKEDTTAREVNNNKEEATTAKPKDVASATAAVVVESKNGEAEPNKAATSANDRKTKMGKQPNVFKTTKILVRNIPFEAKAKEVEELFRVFGELKYVRLPKKIDGAHRGFGFVDFVTLTDAEVSQTSTKK